MAHYGLALGSGWLSYYYSPPGQTLSLTTTDPQYLGFAESIDPETNKIWTATRNTFPDQINPSQIYTSGVTVNQYNLDTTNQTYLPTGDPIQTPVPLSINMQSPIHMPYSYSDLSSKIILQSRFQGEIDITSLGKKEAQEIEQIINQKTSQDPGNRL
jgi:hypothetical protein